MVLPGEGDRVSGSALHFSFAQGTHWLGLRAFEYRCHPDHLGSHGRAPSFRTHCIWKRVVSFFQTQKEGQILQESQRSSSATSIFVGREIWPRTEMSRQMAEQRSRRPSHWYGQLSAQSWPAMETTLPSEAFPVDNYDL